MVKSLFDKQKLNEIECVLNVLTEVSTGDVVDERVTAAAYKDECLRHDIGDSMP